MDLHGALGQDGAVRPGLPDLIFGDNYVAMPFEVPKPGTPLQAFVCTTKNSKNVRGPLTVNTRVTCKSGIIAGNDPVAALWGCDEWPLQTYEVVVDPADLFVGRGEMLLKTSACRVVREVPLEEVFGPRASEIGPILDSIRTTPWLAPKGPPDPDTIARLVREVYAIVGEHQPVRPLPVVVLEEWGGACSADARVGVSEGTPAGLIKTVREVHSPRPEDLDRIAIGTRVLRRILLRQSYARVWEAAWEAAFNASLRSSMQQNRAGDAKAARRTWAKLREKATDRHDAARRAAFRAAQRLHDATPDGEGNLQRDTFSDVDSVLAEVQAAGAADVATAAWNFSLSAIITAIDALEMPVREVERSPSRPLLELFRMGLWPIGEMDDRFFVVYSPMPVSSRR